MKKIYVTKTYLPPLDEYIKYLKGIWKHGHITNHGPLVAKLEKDLKKYLGVKHLFCVSNGTMALQIAIKALGLKNEVITTPFSYVATTSSLVWEGCKPIFADIEPETLTIDPKEIEKKITKKTTGIVATHVYGNPCDVEKIQKIAKKYNLKVLYDAAHAFGVKHNNESLLNQGDISILSFHATKLFHTAEGGAIITNDPKIASKIFHLRNFGHTSSDRPENFAGPGINGKISELHAAVGLAIMPKVDYLIKTRKKATQLYDKLLDWKYLSRPKRLNNNDYNYAYYAIIFPSEKILVKTIKTLNISNIFPRRYFLPSLNTIDYIKKIKPQKTPISEKISKKIVCLPLSHEITNKNIKNICQIINNNLHC